MATRAIYEAPDPAGAIDIRNPGYGFVCAVDTADALTNDSVIQQLAETATTTGLDLEVEEVVTQNAGLGVLGPNTYVAQRATAVQVVVDVDAG